MKQRKDVIKNLIKVVFCLKESKESWIWIREIARRCNLHHKTVSRLIDTYLSHFIVEQNLEPFNIRMIKLKENVNVETLLELIKIKKKLSK